MTDNNQYIDLFYSLIQHRESEVVEFKKAERSFDYDDLGKYFSALSNEANLRGLDFAWLIFGYDEKKHEIVGTSYKDGEQALNNLKHDFSQHTADRLTFREIVPIKVVDKRILLFKKENDTLALHDCISLDAIQKGHRIDEEIAQDLLKRGLIEGEAPNYTISISVAKASKQFPGYTKAKGLEKEKLKQMVLQLLKHAGTDGAMRDVVYDYLKDVLPVNKTKEQQLRFVGRLLVEMGNENLIFRDGLKWLLRSDPTEFTSDPTENQ